MIEQSINFLKRQNHEEVPSHYTCAPQCVKVVKMERYQFSFHVQYFYYYFFFMTTSECSCATHFEANLSEQ